MTPRQYQFIRDILFRFDAEDVHHFSMRYLRMMENLRLLGLVAGKTPQAQPIECMGLTFPNAIGLAAGLDKQGNCIDALGRLGFGHIEIGTITPSPQPGNHSPSLPHHCRRSDHQPYGFQ